MTNAEKVYGGSPVKSQHKVPRKYLNAWKDAEGMIYTARKDGAVFCCKAEGIEAENYYYKFEFLNGKEIEWLVRFVCDKNGLNMPFDLIKPLFQATVGSALLHGVSEGMCMSDNEFSGLLGAIANLKIFDGDFLMAIFGLRLIKRLKPELIYGQPKMDVLRNIVKTGGEMLMCEIEEGAWRALDSVLVGDVQKVNRDDELKLSFAKYLIYQMVRGDKFLEIFNENRPSLPATSLVKIASYIRYFSAEKILFGLSERISRYAFWLIENRTLESFITGDSPVFNLDVSQPTTELSLYFPISPRRAVLLIDGSDINKYRHMLNPGVEDVKRYNQRMCAACMNQVHAESKEALKNCGYRPRWERKQSSKDDRK